MVPEAAAVAAGHDQAAGVGGIVQGELDRGRRARLYRNGAVSATTAIGGGGGRQGGWPGGASGRDALGSFGTGGAAASDSFTLVIVLSGGRRRRRGYGWSAKPGRTFSFTLRD